jgi:hypothetical protein
MILLFLDKGSLPSGGTISLEKWWKEHQGVALDPVFDCRRWRSFALGFSVHCVFSSVVPWSCCRCVTFFFKYIYRKYLSKNASRIDAEPRIPRKIILNGLHKPKSAERSDRT